jgi:hypothetical protein
MQEVQGQELEEGKVYYIESYKWYGHIKTEKLKGVFWYFQASPIDMDIVTFGDLVNGRKSERDGVLKEYPKRTGSFPTDFYKFYLCQKKTIERDVTNRILSIIIGDPNFTWL